MLVTKDITSLKTGAFEHLNLFFNDYRGFIIELINNMCVLLKFFNLIIKL